MLNVNAINGVQVFFVVAAPFPVSPSFCNAYLYRLRLTTTLQPLSSVFVLCRQLLANWTRQHFPSQWWRKKRGSRRTYLQRNCQNVLQRVVLLCVGLIDDANDFPGCSRFALHYVALSYEERVASYSSGLWCVTGLHRQMRTYIGACTFSFTRILSRTRAGTRIQLSGQHCSVYTVCNEKHSCKTHAVVANNSNVALVISQHNVW